MTNIVPFSFESHQIRTITNEQGDPWFVLRDLLESMESATSVTNALDSVKQGLGEGFSAGIPLQTAGGTQQVIIVAEAAATYLLARSNTAKGRELNRFIHVEILPQIRKTGAYQPTHAMLPVEIALKTLECNLRIIELLGIPKSFGVQETAKMMTQQSGIDYTGMLTQAACMNAIPHTDVMLEPTELGKLFDLSGIMMNKKLEELGLQSKVGGQWTPTEAGAPLCERHAWVSGNKSGYNLKWNAGETEKLMEADLA